MLTALVVVLIAFALAFALHRRVLAGHPPPPAGLAVLHRGEAAFVEAIGEVLFPSGGGLAVSGLDARLPHYIDRHLAALPRTKRVQIRLLFFAVEQSTLLMPGDEPGGRRRFSSLSAASRIAILDRLAHHPNDFARLLFTALRSVFVLGYLGHPGNLVGLGLAPFEIAPGVSDAELLFPRVGALPSAIAWSPEEAPAVRTTDEARPPLDPNGPRHRAYVHVTAGAGAGAEAGRGSR